MRAEVSASGPYTWQNFGGGERSSVRLGVKRQGIIMGIDDTVLADDLKSFQTGEH